MGPPDSNVQKNVRNILQNLEGLDPLKELFWSQLNYERVNERLSRKGWGKAATAALAEDPVLFAAGANDEDFHIIYARLDSPKLLLTSERPVVSRLLRDHPYSLFVFSNNAQDCWHFVNVKLAADPKKRRLFRRITVGPEERLRTASERITMLDLGSIGADLFGIAPLAVQERHDEAFDVEAVTKQFYEDYKEVFGRFCADLAEQTDDERWAHDYALQFLNRCMFLYFVQRKRWLGDNPDFLASFWDAYNSAGQPKDTFFQNWLSVLFFEAFNDRFQAGRDDRQHFPGDIREALAIAPYLNGGLFKENELDHLHEFEVSDVRFKQMFEFLEHYNFTISEDSPLDKEVAVDPEMIGKVYESLVNVSEEADERGEAGIFYTPRTEIDLMCRLALVDNLANHLGEEHKNLFYEVVFALEPEEKREADENLAKADLWSDFDEHLQRITVCDPACGSGSFLVGTLHILDDLQRRADQHLEREEPAYDRKKRIIGQNLYGVDVMEWACHVAELRLWLALIIDAEIPREELHARREPLLPHFSFKIRCGDSLVQEVGGIMMSHRRGSTDIPKAIKDRLRKLQNAKLAFYNNQEHAKLKNESQIKNEEVSIFRDFLSHRADALRREAEKLMRQQGKTREMQRDLTGSATELGKKAPQLRAERERRIASLMDEADAIKAERKALTHPQDLPLVWDIAFAEVMESEVGGFDIVIGNPPYVQRESIADPRMPHERATASARREYRAKLARSVYQVWPRFFGYASDDGGVARSLDAKSDLYVYFYFHGMSLLNPEGSFSFITSNSWLDAGYGRDLQEFLIKHGHARLIIDNEVRRSFVSADVNTVIVLFSRPNDSVVGGLPHTARFVMFTVPFEQVLSAVIFQEIEEAEGLVSTAEYRLRSVTHEDLLAIGSIRPPGSEGLERGESHGRMDSPQLLELAQYVGDKWGGKYLRAPDVFFTVFEKGERLLRPLRDFFDGERYLNTGGADGFFVLNDVEEAPNGLYRVHNHQVTADDGPPFDGMIEQEYLVPLIKDYTKTRKQIRVDGYDAYCLVVDGPPTPRLQKYIEWGEAQGYDQRSVTRHRQPWYKPTKQMKTGAAVLVPRSFNDSFVVYQNPNGYLSLRFYRLHPKNARTSRLVAFLNSSLVALVLETLGSKNLGQGVLNFYMADFLTIRMPVVVGPDRLEAALERLAEREIKTVWEEYGVNEDQLGQASPDPPDDRRELDEIVFGELGLTPDEQDAVYEAILNLVSARLRKAKSV